MENSRTRESVEQTFTDIAIKQIIDKRNFRIDQKGDGTFASVHEILGIVTEEYHELIVAVQENDTEEIRQELIDIAVSCLHGVACINAGTLDW